MCSLEAASQYTRGALDRDDLDPDPIALFRAWFQTARDAGVHEPTAMTLATASPDGMPSARMVLLKGVDDRGFVFYTNYESRKGREIESNPHAALVFYWAPLERQVRVAGAVERLSRAESDVYFQSRPPGSRLGAWASHQSEAIPDRGVLDARLDELARQYADGEIPLPPFWGGLRVVPTAIEFWQGRLNRLHDRFLYTRDGQSWRIERLSP